MDRKKVVISLFSIIGLWGLIKLVLYKVVPHQDLFEFFHITRFDCMAVGGLFAFVYNHNRYRLQIIIQNRVMQIGAYLILLLVIFNLFEVNKLINHFLIAVSTGLIILDQISTKPLIELKSKYLDKIGEISFGIYIYHSLIIFEVTKFANYSGLSGQYYNVFVILGSIILTIVVANLSYIFIESKVLAYKRNFTS